MDSARLCEIVSDTTVVLKGQALVEERKANGLRPIPLREAMPAEKVMSLVENVGEGIVAIGIYATRAEILRKDLLAALGDAVKANGLLEEPSTYIALAQTFGLEDMVAIRLMALGTHLDLWQVRKFRPEEMIAAGILTIVWYNQEVRFLLKCLTS